MRFVGKPMLLAMLAIAVTALVTPSALAQTEPKLHPQGPRLIVAQEVHAANDVACPAVTPNPPPNPGPLVTTGGCRVHAVAPNVVLSAHLSAGGTEVVVSTCNIEFDARLDNAGEGYIAHQEFTQGTQGSCTRQVCGQPNAPTGEGRAYTFYLEETEVPGQGPREEGVVLFCTEPIGQTAPSHCEVRGIRSSPTTHRGRITLNDAVGHGTIFPHCELVGTFDQEAVLGTTGEGQLEQNVEVRHT